MLVNMRGNNSVYLKFLFLFGKINAPMNYYKRKYFLILLSLFLLTLITGCQKEDIRTIKIYNCVDYIDEAVLDQFVEK